MSTTIRRGAMRLALSFVIAASTVAGGAIVSATSALASASSTLASLGSGQHDRLQSRLATSGTAGESAAAAQTCVDAKNNPATCPTVLSVTYAGPPLIRRSKTAPVDFSVSVVVDDPSDIAADMDMAIGRGLETPDPTVVLGEGWASSMSANGTHKTFTGTMSSPYTPLYPAGAAPTYGDFQIITFIWGVDPTDPAGSPANQFLAQGFGSGSIKAQSVITNTPSATTVHRAQWFTERGRLTRFDGTPQVGQKVNVYYVPAGTTRASFAGVATSSSTGALSLPCRSWLTGSWFLNYPGSAFSTGIYKSVWIKVVA